MYHSSEDQQIILECAKESSFYQRKLWKEQETKSSELAVDAGAKVVHLSTVEKKKFRKAVEPLYERYCEDYKDMIHEILCVK